MSVEVRTADGIAEVVIDFPPVNALPVRGWYDLAAALTGAGADHIVEVGGASTLPKSMKAVRMGGTISLIGNVAGGGEVNSGPR